MCYVMKDDKVLIIGQKFGKLYKLNHLMLNKRIEFVEERTVELSSEEECRSDGVMMRYTLNCQQ